MMKFSLPKNLVTPSLEDLTSSMYSEISKLPIFGELDRMVARVDGNPPKILICLSERSPSHISWAILVYKKGLLKSSYEYSKIGSVTQDQYIQLLQAYFMLKAANAKYIINRATFGWDTGKPSAVTPDFWLDKSILPIERGLKFTGDVSDMLKSDVMLTPDGAGDKANKIKIS